MMDKVGLKSVDKKSPKVTSVDKIDDFRSQVTVDTLGLGISEFRAKMDRMTSCFRQTVESIDLSKDKSRVILHLSERDLPEMVCFHSLYEHITKPYSFIVGESMKGPIVRNIRTLPHLMASGATGGGKSVFFRSMMLALLKSSPHIQLYLLDLKKGVEVKEFNVLPNVTTAKNETEATNLLAALVEEMNKRYVYLEEKGYKSIEPKRDKMDILIVGIDEAAALLGKGKGDKARQYVNELARLARAAGIHLVPATQKPIKNAIDTETLDNIPGRMTFKMISSAASTAATGDNSAKKLPDTKGRAIWTIGSKQTEVQTPFIEDEDLVAEINEIQQEFLKRVRVNYSEMLVPGRKGSKNDEPETQGE